MDLVECEAPLDSSFQKDRLELVNKGSLGRRRKPSRSNLRLILSPANDRQDIFGFDESSQHFGTEGSVVIHQKKVTPHNGVVLDNLLKTENKSSQNHKNSTNCQKRVSPPSGCYQNGVVSSNYRELVASINYLCHDKSVDLNGNSDHQLRVTSASKQRFIEHIGDKLVGKNQGQVKSVNNNLNFKRNNVRNQQNCNAKNHEESFKLDNVSYIKFKPNGFCNPVTPKSTRSLESKSFQKEDACNGLHNQQTVASKNRKNIITFSNRRQIVTSTPIHTKNQAVANGVSTVKCSEPTISQKNLPKSQIESSLPRTSKEPDLVADAQQFSIEAKLRRKKSEGGHQGRSAVLIQTWERRTLSDSFSKIRRDSKSAPKNRFAQTEIFDGDTGAMPDSYICIKYKGSLQNGDNLLAGGVVRDVESNDTMLYRVQEDKSRASQLAGATNSAAMVASDKKPVQEPEWISLSRKLCAKFVEGHIEPNSPDSYRQEEPEGVGVEFVPTSLQHSNQNKTYSSPKVALPTETPKKKVTPTIASEETRTNGEPPWIHLSRKLCTKFIEEHIEFPPITNGHLVEVPELVEPNGDVRIIEKIGKPKDQKSKLKKECEPEWVSLSKKLRAKFIESHIDDPDTIALDNQLNASDPEETASETLSDISQETAVPKMVAESLECKNFKVNTSARRVNSALQENQNTTNIAVNECSSLFPEKECCWEYQEMEFDQESNSGNFQEFEICSHPLQEAKIHRGSLPEDTSNNFKERITFENSYVPDSLECYNNDVNFGSNSRGNDPINENSQQSKIITVQFVAHTGKQNDKHEKGTSVVDGSKVTRHGSFFNLSTWEEANYKGDDNNHQNSKEEALGKNFRSKSLDNLCDSLEETTFKKNENSRVDETENHLSSRDGLDPLAGSEKVVLQKDSEMVHREFKTSASGCASDVYEIQESDNQVSPDMISVKGQTTDWEEFEFAEKQNDVGDDTANEELSGVHSMAEKANWSSESMFNDTESDASDWNKYNHSEKKQNIYHARNEESSSEDEVFEDSSRNGELPLNSSGRSLYGKISNRNDSLTEGTKSINEEQVGNEKVKSDPSVKICKNIKSNGVIPNSICNDFPDNKVSSSKFSQKEIARQNSPKEPVKMGMSKWITMSKSEQNINKPEYSNVQSSILSEQKNGVTHSEKETRSKNKSKQNSKESKMKNDFNSASDFSPKNSSRSKYDNSGSPDFNKCNGNSNRSVKTKESDLKKAKCKSMLDISNNNTNHDLNFRHHESEADLCSAAQTPSNHSRIEFQHFEFDSEIPLCAKLVSKHDKKKLSKSIPSALPIYRAESPCPSESSHLYEDMFKETPSGPSDSEASSWTAMKNNTYYINGRSSSMNDLDVSDSCSLSMKCDYASSSENSTLQSRHSSYASSSFYVNLRDYDSHMLEPTLNKDKRNDRLKTSFNSSVNASKSNPPTPESLRHLFTSPLNSVHSAPGRTAKLLNRMPSDPQSHYYSTAAVTSSAFKHGFASTTPKQKKTERSSSLKIKDIAHGIMLTFKRFQNGSKNSSLSSSQVDVSHLAEMKSNSEIGITQKYPKNSKKQNRDKDYCTENGKTDTDSGFLSDVQRAKARRSSSDLTGMKPPSDFFQSSKKKDKHSKKNNKDKAKKSKSKASEPRTVPTVSRKVQQMADGTLYLVTTVSGDTSMPGVYSDSPDSSSELSGHKPFRLPEESNC